MNCWTQLLLAVCLFGFGCNGPSPGAAKDSGQRSELPKAESLQVKTNELVRIDLTQPGQDPVTIRLANGYWRIESPIAFPASAQAIGSIVAVLAEIETLRTESDRPAPKHRLDPASAITVQAWTEKGARQPFSIGASVGEETYVQRNGDDTVYAVRGRCRRFFALSLKELRDNNITKLDIDAIERVTYVRSEHEFVLVAAPGELGQFVEEAPSIPNFDRQRARKNVEVLANLYAKGFEDSTKDKSLSGLYSSNTPRISIEMRGRDTPLEVFLGAQNDRHLMYLRTSASQQVYLVSAHLASTLLPEPKHFERIGNSGLGKPARVGVRPDVVAPAESSKHEHGSEPPTKVSAELMSELRGLAKEQRIRGP